ncbi:cobalamin biosynthesis protein CobD [Syntrophotalea acetylenivorans]|uniref:Cobalamin biosynthesis protein CobD n=1 Tax=Syntrophotalea acetylenivorans TaxID=1842532 RepID=A0A1L3GNE5_9BACT|nr:adenosylcobinamide-phosphate synthase CbiB [Syntrophotalea acetylenivorans]APG27459.1 cobalamin biosynthesis protein CobD [Syntrophotalea acetylenivorans]
MTLELQILAAIGLDMLWGDPRRMPHPVKGIGRLAMALEGPMRKWFADPRLAGLVTVIIVISATAAATALLLIAASRLHPWAGDALSILLLSTCLAGRDLAAHARQVFKALQQNNLELARERVAWMVGRDTASMNRADIVRAGVESVAENTVDGVTAPLFWAVLLGPVGALVYKAASTLDSTFGYKNERYLHFGWASARLDDVLNYLPARLTLPLTVVAAALLGLHPANSWSIALRDRRKHASPNSGWSEAATAGALGIQLGGPVYRQGKLSDMPLFGDGGEPLAPTHIEQAVRLMLLTSLLAAVAFLGMRVGWGWLIWG